MKDYSIRIVNGHHVVNMKPNKNEIVLAIENAIEEFKKIAHKITLATNHKEDK